MRGEHSLYRNRSYPPAPIYSTPGAKGSTLCRLNPGIRNLDSVSIPYITDSTLCHRVPLYRSATRCNHD